MNKPAAKPPENAAPTGDKARTPRYCGIVRPIAEMGNYTAKHWREVHNVISEAVEPLGFTLRLVSESDNAGVILTEIVSNLYEDEIVVVDVSGRNPNVMFELGMRLAFEKPAIIVMDDETPFSFDISPVKHIRYPRTLRYSDIVKFKSDLSTAVTATIESGPDKKNYLQQFGPIKVTELGSQSVELNTVAQDVQELKRLMVNMMQQSEYIYGDVPLYNSRTYLGSKEQETNSILEVEIPENKRHQFGMEVSAFFNVSGVEELPKGFRVYIEARSSNEMSDTRNKIRTLGRQFRNGER